MLHKNTINYNPNNLYSLKEQLLSLIGAIKKLEITDNASAYNQFQEQKRKAAVLIKNIENLHQECDEAIIHMSPEQRKPIKNKLPSFIDFFGWNNRIKDDGSISYDD